MKAHACSRRHFLGVATTAALAAPLGSLPFGRAFAAPSKSDAKVAIASCKTYALPEVRGAMNQCFDQLGGIGSLVRGKTVAVKLNLTGTDFSDYMGRPVGETYMTHEATAVALAGALFK